ncbi:MAG: topoisomerase [Chloroflexota bacterium]|nr:topoisomerase [Chloroflexota bacterium]
MSDAGPVEAAHDAGLIYTSDSEAGIRRVRKGRSFTYVDAEGKIVRDPAVLERITSLAVPPAWKDVWICARPRGHLQATGRDSRGRKQFRYHPRWRETRDADKYARLLGFAHALPRIRARVARDLRLPGLPREKVIATIVKLLETTFARVGNEEYARENGSFGLTTLRNRHVKVRGATVRFLFRGKSGREHELGVTDRRVASVIKRCEELPGQMLFQYVDENGERGLVTSDDVNGYLRETTGEDFTAKDFRTWAGTLLAACALRDVARFESESEAKRNVLAAIDSVARKLGHTRAVCRRAYVHPAVIDTYLEGSLEKALDIEHATRRGRLRADEMALVAFLKRTTRRRKAGERPVTKAA